MKKVKDILKLLSAQITSNELSTIAGASNLEEVEVTDDGYKEIKEQVSSLMTLEAATHNPEVEKEILKIKEPEIKNQTLFSVEKRLKAFAKIVGFDLEDKEKAHEILDIFDLKVKDLLSKGADEDTLKLIAAQKDEITDLNNQVLNTQKEGDEKLEVQKIESSQRELKSQFMLQAKSRNWADAYKGDEFNGIVLEKVWNTVNSKATLTKKDGVIVPMQKDNPEKELFIGNKKVTFQDLIDPEFEPYLKKSDPGGTGQGEETKTDTSEDTQAVKSARQMQKVFG